MKESLAMVGSDQRTRQTLGAIVTAIASLATIATSYGQMQDEVSLPVQLVSVNQSSPTQTSRFRIESTWNMAHIEASLDMADAVTPRVTVAPIQGGTGTITRSTIESQVADSRHARQEVNVWLTCPNTAPCSFDLEISVTAENLSAATTTGTLTVKARVAGSSLSDDKYFAIEPL